MSGLTIFGNERTSCRLSISCFLNYVSDSWDDLSDHCDENIWLASSGGGIGGYSRDVRSNGIPAAHGSRFTSFIPYLDLIMGTIITLTRPESCNECGAHIPVGREAYYYGNHGFYGIGCHPRNGRKFPRQSNIGRIPTKAGVEKESLVDRKKKEGVTSEMTLKNTELRRLKAEREKINRILSSLHAENKNLKIENRTYKFQKTFGSKAEACQECCGDGYQNSRACPRCNGTGFVN